MIKSKHVSRLLKLAGVAIVVVIALSLGFGKKSAAVGPFAADANTYAIYHFEGDCNDSSGRGNNLSLVDGAFNADSAVGSQALSGACLGDSLDLDHVVDGGSDWTIAFWLKVNSDIRNNSPYTTILRMDSGAGCDGQVTNCGVAIVNSDGRVQWWRGGGTPGAVDDDHYHHIAIRADHASGAVDFFVDGVLVSSLISDPRWAIPPTTRFHINAFISCCDGHMDELILENRKMTDAEILSLAGKTPPDTTPPAISHTTLAPQYLLNSPALAFSYSATDPDSAVSALAATLDGTPFVSGGNLNFSAVGPHVIVITASDPAGNTASTTVNYSVVYGAGTSGGGFLPPIKNDGTGVYKLGSTLPTKFRLTDVSGNFVSTAVAHLFAAKVQSGVPDGDISVVSTSAADTGNTFRASGNQYEFNLNTGTLAVGVWQLKAVLDDGTNRIAIISIK